MADTDPELWCLNEGDTIPFTVPASDVYIATLKKIIKDKVKFDAPASRLNLWKPREEISIKPSNTLAQRIRDLGSGFSQFEQLDPVDTVSNVFRPQPQTPTSPHLDVFVQIPISIPPDEPPSERGSSTNISIFSWLVEVHSKIWGRKDLEPELFREVEVTQAHYDELQRRLNEQHPDRNAPKYDGRQHDVRSVQLDVLRLIFPANPPPNNNEGHAPEASGNDESRMDVDESEPSNYGFPTDTIFPFTLRFLDMSTLSLSTDISQRLPLPLLVREEYGQLSTLIKNEPVNGHGSVIVSGQPGTGKTAYLHLRVIESMIDGRSFLYQDLNSIVYHINETGVRAIRSWSSDEIVAFVDGDREGHEPSTMFLGDNVQIILATSPKGENRKWKQQAGGVKTIVTKSWSPHELFLAGVFLYPLDISPELLKESTVYFGYNPRRCFYSASSALRLVEMKGEIESRITAITSKESNMVQVLYSSRTGDIDVSHSIFEISPRDELRLLSQCKFGYVSQWALDCFLEAYETRQAAAATDFYRYISGVPNAASLWGHVFERLVFKHLVGIDAKHKFRMRRLSGPILRKMTWTFHGPIPRFNFRREMDFIGAITNAVRNKSPVHLVPSARNFAAVDSIVYDPKEVLTCIQITVSGQHPISVSGLRRMQSWLEPGTPLAHLRPSKANPNPKNRSWRLIFIVPSGLEESFELQTLEGDTDQGEWAGKVHQYVLGLDVFKKPE